MTTDAKNMDDGWDTVPTETVAPVAQESAAAVEDETDGEEAETEEEDARGPRPRFREAMRAKCFECCGDMYDGRIDCKVTKCPLYYWQPYRKETPDLAWRTEGYHLSKNRTPEWRARFKHVGEEDTNA